MRSSSVKMERMQGIMICREDEGENFMLDALEYRAADDRYQSMEYRKSGKSGLKLPVISLGLWHNFGSKDNYDNMKAMLFTAFDHGITHFDLANNYGPIYGSAEANFGRIYKDFFRPYRNELIISTKAGYDMWEGPYGNGGSRKYLISSIDASLKRMNLEYVDIFYHHRMDPETPIEETMLALEQIVRSGKALYAGISNYDGEHMKEALAIAKEIHLPLIINQNRYSIFDRTIENNGLKSAAREQGMGVICFSPLAQGMLSDKYLQGIPEDSRIARDGRFLKERDITTEKLAKVRVLNDLARERGQTLPQMALSWDLKDAEITSVLIGASKPAQIIENLGILGNTSFTEEEIRRIDEISLGKYYRKNQI